MNFAGIVFLHSYDFGEIKDTAGKQALEANLCKGPRLGYAMDFN